MQKLIGALVGAMCLFGGAQADIITSSDPAKVPHSIWQIAPDGTATHLQSGMVCPPEVNDFNRNKLTLYDAVGFDVSCGYNGPHGWITVYLTRLGTMSLQAAFDDAKAQLLHHAPDAKPAPDADQKTFAGAEDYLHLTYSQKNGAEWSGIWMTDFSGWMFEFRATYEPGAEAEMLDELAELTRRARAEAGAHLALCAKSTVPVRDGKSITDNTEVAALSIMLGALAFEVDIPMKDEKGNSKGAIKPQQPVVWCAETLVEGFKLPILLWHAVTAEGQTQRFDQVTVSTYSASPELQSRVSDAGILFDAAGKDGKSRFVITMRKGDEVYLYGAYVGRPSAEELGRIMTDYFDDHAKPLAAVNIKTNTITMFQGPKK